MARWDNDARYHNSLLNQAWDRSLVEYLQWERYRPKQQKRYVAQGARRNTDDTSHKCASPRVTAHLRRTQLYGPHRRTYALPIDRAQPETPLPITAEELQRVGRQQFEQFKLELFHLVGQQRVAMV